MYSRQTPLWANTYHLFQTSPGGKYRFGQHDDDVTEVKFHGNDSYVDGSEYVADLINNMTLEDIKYNLLDELTRKYNDDDQIRKILEYIYDVYDEDGKSKEDTDKVMEALKDIYESLKVSSEDPENASEPVESDDGEWYLCGYKDEKKCKWKTKHKFLVAEHERLAHGRVWTKKRGRTQSNETTTTDGDKKKVRRNAVVAKEHVDPVANSKPVTMQIVDPDVKGDTGITNVGAQNPYVYVTKEEEEKQTVVFAAKNGQSILTHDVSEKVANEIRADILNNLAPAYDILENGYFEGVSEKDNIPSVILGDGDQQEDIVNDPDHLFDLAPEDKRDEKGDLKREYTLHKWLKPADSDGKTLANIIPSDAQTKVLQLKDVHRKNILIAHQPGEGKTLNAIILAEMKRNIWKKIYPDNDPPHILVVTPNASILKQWQDSVVRWGFDPRHWIFQTINMFQLTQSRNTYPRQEDFTDVERGFYNSIWDDPDNPKQISELEFDGKLFNEYTEEHERDEWKKYFQRYDKTKKTVTKFKQPWKKSPTRKDFRKVLEDKLFDCKSMQYFKIADFNAESMKKLAELDFIVWNGKPVSEYMHFMIKIDKDMYIKTSDLPNNPEQPQPYDFAPGDEPVTKILPFKGEINVYDYDGNQLKDENGANVTTSYNPGKHKNILNPVEYLDSGNHDAIKNLFLQDNQSVDDFGEHEGDMIFFIVGDEEDKKLHVVTSLICEDATVDTDRRGYVFKLKSEDLDESALSDIDKHFKIKRSDSIKDAFTIKELILEISTTPKLGFLYQLANDADHPDGLIEHKYKAKPGGIFIVDESHTALSTNEDKTTTRNVLSYCRKASSVILVSATPFLSAEPLAMLKTTCKALKVNAGGTINDICNSLYGLVTRKMFLSNDMKEKLDARHLSKAEASTIFGHFAYGNSFTLSAPPKGYKLDEWKKRFAYAALESMCTKPLDDNREDPKFPAKVQMYDNGYKEVPIDDLRCAISAGIKYMVTDFSYRSGERNDINWDYVDFHLEDSQSLQKRFGSSNVRPLVVTIRAGRDVVRVNKTTMKKVSEPLNLKKSYEDKRIKYLTYLQRVAYAMKDKMVIVITKDDNYDEETALNRISVGTYDGQQPLSVNAQWEVNPKSKKRLLQKMKDEPAMEYINKGDSGDNECKWVRTKKLVEKDKLQYEIIPNVIPPKIRELVRDIERAIDSGKNVLVYHDDIRILNAVGHALAIRRHRRVQLSPSKALDQDEIEKWVEEQRDKHLKKWEKWEDNYRVNYRLLEIEALLDIIKKIETKDSEAGLQQYKTAMVSLFDTKLGLNAKYKDTDDFLPRFTHILVKATGNVLKLKRDLYTSANGYWPVEHSEDGENYKEYPDHECTPLYQLGADRCIMDGLLKIYEGNTFNDLDFRRYPLSQIDKVIKRLRRTVSGSDREVLGELNEILKEVRRYNEEEDKRFLSELIEDRRNATSRPLFQEIYKYLKEYLSARGNTDAEPLKTALREDSNELFEVSDVTWEQLNDIEAIIKESMTLEIQEKLSKCKENAKSNPQEHMKTYVTILHYARIWIPVKKLNASLGVKLDDPESVKKIKTRENTSEEKGTADERKKIEELRQEEQRVRTSIKVQETKFTIEKTKHKEELTEKRKIIKDKDGIEYRKRIRNEVTDLTKTLETLNKQIDNMPKRDDLDASQLYDLNMKQLEIQEKEKLLEDKNTLIERSKNKSDRETSSAKTKKLEIETEFAKYRAEHDKKVTDLKRKLPTLITKRKAIEEAIHYQPTYPDAKEVLEALGKTQVDMEKEKIPIDKVKEYLQKLQLLGETNLGERSIDKMLYNIEGAEENRVSYGIITAQHAPTADDKKFYKMAFEHGMIDCLLINKAMRMGLDFKSPRESLCIMVDPLRNPGAEDQFVGRLVRNGSHALCPPEFRQVGYYSMVGTYTQSPSQSAPESAPESDEEVEDPTEDEQLGVHKKFWWSRATESIHSDSNISAVCCYKHEAFSTPLALSRYLTGDKLTTCHSCDRQGCDVCKWDIYDNDENKERRYYLHDYKEDVEGNTTVLKKDNDRMNDYKKNRQLMDLIDLKLMPVSVEHALKCKDDFNLKIRYIQPGGRESAVYRRIQGKDKVVKCDTSPLNKFQLIMADRYNDLCYEYSDDESVDDNPDDKERVSEESDSQEDGDDQEQETGVIERVSEESGSQENEPVIEVSDDNPGDKEGVVLEESDIQENEPVIEVSGEKYSSEKEEEKEEEEEYSSSSDSSDSDSSSSDSSDSGSSREGEESEGEESEGEESDSDSGTSSSDSDSSSSDSEEENGDEAYKPRKRKTNKYTSDNLEHYSSDSDWE